MTASAEKGAGPAVATDIAPAPPRYRSIIFFAVVLGANLQVLDTTMATVALPRMQGAALRSRRFVAKTSSTSPS